MPNTFDEKQIDAEIARLEDVVQRMRGLCTTSASPSNVRVVRKLQRCANLLADEVENLDKEVSENWQQEQFRKAASAR